MSTTFLREADPKPNGKPSAALVHAMKRCVSPGVAQSSLQLVDPEDGLEVIVKADLPWFAGVTSTDILSAVAADAKCFTPSQLQEQV